MELLVINCCCFCYCCSCSCTCRRCYYSAPCCSCVAAVAHAPRCSRSINAIHSLSLKWSTIKTQVEANGNAEGKEGEETEEVYPPQKDGRTRGKRREQSIEREQGKERGKGYSNWKTESKASADSKTGVIASPLWAPRAPYRVCELQQQMLLQSGEFCERRWQLECGINGTSLKWRQ